MFKFFAYLCRNENIHYNIYNHLKHYNYGQEKIY